MHSETTICHFWLHYSHNTTKIEPRKLCSISIIPYVSHQQLENQITVNFQNVALTLCESHCVQTANELLVN